ncbi:MAG TPA: hypothetical protein VFJ58_29790 [Armatimonadota bacterium]|nr:hypothetical protein [Armatimonadota bacterium]
MLFGSTRVRTAPAPVRSTSLIKALCLCLSLVLFPLSAAPPAAADSTAAPLTSHLESCLAAPGVRRDVEVVEDPTPEPTDDPLFHTHYDTDVLGKVFEDGAWQTRFRVYYQGQQHALAVKVADLLTRFYCYGRERLDPSGAFISPVHSIAMPDGSERAEPTNFYLDNGHPGGGRESDGRMYMLQSSTPRNPLEVVREVAHEFSHLTVPGIHEFSDSAAPEDWLNGYLGESLYMEWLGDDTEQTVIPAATVSNWSAGRQRVLEDAFLKLGPQRLLREPAAHFWEVAGLLLYLKQLYGTEAMARVLKFSNDFRRNTASAITLNMDDALSTEKWDSVTVPGGLAAPIDGDADPGANPQNSVSIAPGAAVRAWVFLHAGAHRLKIAVDGVNWRLRGARIGSGKAWAPLGTVTAGTASIDFPASGSGWYETQWRNTGSQPMNLLGWTWQRATGEGTKQ